MPKTAILSNRIPLALKDKLKRTVKNNGHRINYVLEKLIEQYIQYGLDERVQ